MHVLQEGNREYEDCAERVLQKGYKKWQQAEKDGDDTEIRLMVLSAKWCNQSALTHEHELERSNTACKKVKATEHLSMVGAPTSRKLTFVAPPILENCLLVSDVIAAHPLTFHSNDTTSPLPVRRLAVLKQCLSSTSSRRVWFFNVVLRQSPSYRSIDVRSGCFTSSRSTGQLRRRWAPHCILRLIFVVSSILQVASPA